MLTTKETLKQASKKQERNEETKQANCKNALTQQCNKQTGKLQVRLQVMNQ